MLSDNFIIHITKRADPEFIQAMLEKMNNILNYYEINNALRIAHFLAQAMHESMDFTAKRESLNYSVKGLQAVFGKYFSFQMAHKYGRIDGQQSADQRAIANIVYANRLGNGPPESDDGWNYRGAGIFQLTGRSNYRKYGSFLNVDLENNPDLAVEPSISFEIACVYWDQNNLNIPADKNDIVAITRAINGGENGLQDRRNRFNYLFPIIRNEFDNE